MAHFEETFKATVIPHPRGNHWERAVSVNAKPYYQTKVNKLPLGATVWLTIDNRKPKMSDAQRRLYWLYMHSIEAETGNDSDALHELFKEQFGPYKLKTVDRFELVNGVQTRVGTKELKIFKSLSEYSKDEFSEYILKIEQVTGIPVPDTEGYLYGDMREAFEAKRKDLEEHYQDDGSNVAF